jgi:hypothetical protein
MMMHKGIQLNMYFNEERGGKVEANMKEAEIHERFNTNK